MLIVFAWVVVAGWSEIRHVVATVLGARWPWVLVATSLLMSRYVLYAVLYRVAFAIVGVHSSMGALISLIFASLFANLASSAASGALFVDDANQRGQSASCTVAGMLLVTLADDTSLALFLIASLGYLALHRALYTYAVIGTVLFAAMYVVTLGALFLARWQPELLHRILEWLQHTLRSVAGKLKRLPPTSDGWIDESVACFATAAMAVRARPREILRILATALLGQMLGVLGVCALFPAFFQPIEPGTMLAGYAMGALASNVGITPQGIGVVEGAMALTYASLGVPPTTAIAIGLAFRGASFWLPLLVGLFFFSRSRSLRR